MSRKKSPFVLLLLLLLGLAACGPEPSNQNTPTPPTTDPQSTPLPSPAGSKHVNIGIVVKTNASTYWKIVGEGALEAATEHPNDATVNFIGPDSEQNVEGQISMVEDQIANKVSVLVVAPSSSERLKPSFDKAKAAGIPVILIDTDADWPGKASFIGTDNEHGGKLAGDYIVKNLSKGDKVAIIRGDPGDSTHDARQKGAEDLLKAAGLNVVTVQPANSDRTKGQSVMQSILGSNPDLKAVFCTNDEMALGAAAAAKQAGKHLIIVGFDANPDALIAIKSGDMSASVAQFPKNIGKLGVENAIKLAQGQPIDKRIDTGTELVTTDNLAQFMKPAATP